MVLSLLLTISISSILKALGWIAFAKCCFIVLQTIAMYGFVAVSGKNPIKRILWHALIALVLFCLCTQTGVRW